MGACEKLIYLIIPSFVLNLSTDVRTQAMYQLLDSGFIGLIFSCFSEDAQKVSANEIIAEIPTFFNLF